ncbi:hsp70 nucleotide exchange factor fes1 [Coniosporium apollinis]|uniref:Hsp70 nucleotide exchange factor fes1 n=2 Tax=Coniosporium TaxID=2810619 RepID=A0ABQ9NSF1_9PEZI|nr:hsp70 nucleotide exchange factor fes1 [Cladosporium sp. JES 115]KAJ9662702.1 hsp70 nucleotide exchange factor fes1 [Coniosporium apollinis]
MANPGLSELLKWSVENSAASRDDPASQTDQQGTRDASRGLSADALAALLGGPSDADRMRDAMAAIVSPDVDLDNKLIAFDNFEQLIENLDNTNNMEPLGLWMPLVSQLNHEEPEMRRMAAWCIGTAVQNNPRAQERLLVLGGIPILVRIATDDNNQATRKKAITALSSEVRNFQPGLDAAVKALPEAQRPAAKVDAGNMEEVDTVIQQLRDRSEARG